MPQPLQRERKGPWSTSGWWWCPLNGDSEDDSKESSTEEEVDNSSGMRYNLLWYFHACIQNDTAMRHDQVTGEVDMGLMMGHLSSLSNTLHKLNMLLIQDIIKNELIQWLFLTWECIKHIKFHKMFTKSLTFHLFFCDNNIYILNNHIHLFTLYRPRKINWQLVI